MSSVTDFLGDVGVDVGLLSLVTMSDGEKVKHPRFYRDAQRKLRIAQRSVARKTKGGKNRRKAVLVLQRQHDKIKNQRKDYLNKLALDLITRYDRIALEDLTITRMVHGNLAKSILDAGWGYLVKQLTYKAESAGAEAIFVNPKNTTKTCCMCGNLQDMPLSERTYACKLCGNSIDRDINAAKNILTRATAGMVGSNASGDGIAIPSSMEEAHAFRRSRQNHRSRQ